MTDRPASRFWALAAVLLVSIIITGGVTVALKYHPTQPIEILLPPGPEIRGKIFIGGAINNPGLYPLKAGDSLEALVQGAGGTTDGADLSRINLRVPGAGEETQPQKVNLNRAEVWLLQALPGIGEVRAQAIIAYRQKNGLFKSTDELTEVEGLGTSTYERIKDLITVTD